MGEGKRPIRIASISGAAGDRGHEMALAASSDDSVDVIIGDWMSEMNMPTRAYAISEGLDIGYEVSFLNSLKSSIENIAKRGIKVVCNAGAVSTKQLHQQVLQLVAEKGLSLKVAWVEGDVVSVDEIMALAASGSSDFPNICTGMKLKDWALKPFFGQCYLGGWGIKTALDAGADIVICGRVADASPLVGSSAWWHGWSRDENFNELAQALIAGHLIECTTYVTGGNFTGFKSLNWDTIHDIGFPYAEIASDGDVIITKKKNTGGMVTVETCKEQLLYEIQGCYYYNSDVTAKIDEAKFEQLEPDRVRLSGITGLPPPPHTKVGLTAFGGYKAEIHWCLVGLDIEEKVKMVTLQMKHNLGEKRLSKFSTFAVTTNGSVPYDPLNQNSAIVDVRVIAQAKEKEDLSEANFLRPASSVIMESYPAATFHRDNRTAIPTPFQEYFVSLIPQSMLNHVVHLPDRDIVVTAPASTILLPAQQPSYETTNPIDLSAFGGTVKAPLGYIVHARAGDKGSNCNIGLFVRNEDEWDWLRSFLTTGKLRTLMAQDFKGQKIDRMEFPKLWAVHFLIHDHLDRSVHASTSYDILGKFLAEYIRCKPVDLPKRFLDRGKI